MDRNKKRVLVVEDEADMRKALEIKLLQAGYQVDVAEDGKKALEILETQEPNIILLDLVMPVMDGIDFLKALRLELHKKTPVLVLTVITSSILPEQAKALEIEDYLIKDRVSLDEIVEKVAKKIG